MWWYYLLRWFIFLVVGAPLQQIANLLWIPLSAWFWFSVRGRAGAPLTPPSSPRFTTDFLISQGKLDALRDETDVPNPKGPYLNIGDDNGAIIHMFLWALRPELSRAGLKGLVDPTNGAMMRKCPLEGDLIAPAGDDLSAWTSAYASTGGDPEDLHKVTWHWVKNCMGIGSWCEGWQVSSRSSSSGINWTFDGTWYLNYPAISVSYFNTAPLLRLAARDLNPLWWLAYFAHYWVMGGWLWWALPWCNLASNTFYYSQEICLLNLRTLAMLAGNPISRAMYRWAIRFIVIHCADQGNCDPVFYGLAAPSGALTQAEIDRALAAIVCMKPLWPQNEPWAASFYDADMTGGYANFYSTAGATVQALLAAKE